MRGKVYEVKVIGVQRIAIRDAQGDMSEDDIVDAALDIGGMPRSAMDEASITESADYGTGAAESIIRHADEKDFHG